MRVFSDGSAADRPLVLVTSNQGISTGALFSLAYHLQSGVVLWVPPDADTPQLPGGFGDLLVLTASAPLRKRIEHTHRLAPMHGTWQWFQAEPRGRGNK